jgi:hypothetical protein
MTNESAGIFFLGERNIHGTLERASKAAGICMAIAGENTRTGVKAAGDAAALAGALWTARGVQEAVRAQVNYARQSFEDHVSNAAKVGALWIDLYKETFRVFEAGRDPGAGRRTDSAN